MDTQSKAIHEVCLEVVTKIESTLLMAGGRKRALALRLVADILLESGCESDPAQVERCLEEAVLAVKRPPLWRWRRARLRLGRSPYSWRRKASIS